MNAKEIISSTILQAQKQIELMSAELDAPVLDGTPWMITTSDPNGNTMIFGEWELGIPGIKSTGYLRIEAVPNHACGAFTVSEKSANLYIERNAKAGKSVGKMHVMSFKAKRIEELQALITSLENL